MEATAMDKVSTDLVTVFSRSEAREPSVAIVGDHFTSGLDTAVTATAGTGGAARLTPGPGCYSVVVTHRGGLVAYADPVGQFPLYWAEAGDRVLVGPSTTALAVAIGAGVDLVSLAARIACPDTPDLLADRTMYRHVRRIPDGTQFQVDDHGVRQTEHHRIRVDPAVGMADAADRLRDCLRASVQARADAAGRLSADFSGGFDSTSLAFLAGTGNRPVVVLTSDGLTAGSDDVERARGYGRLNPNLVHHVVATPAGGLPFQNLVAAGDEPYATPMFLGSLRARLAAAREAGADLHLVGEGGDVLLGAPPAYLADLARRGDLTTLWQHCLAWARLRTRSPHRLFRRAVALGATSRRRALLLLARDIERGRSVGTSSWEEEWICWGRRPRADWLTARARKELAASVRDTAVHDPGPDGIGDRVTRSWLRSQALTQRAVRDAGQELGIRVHAPFLDVDVVRACLSLPAYRRADTTVHKPLLRKALANLVPKAVLSHAAKGDYTRETYLGVRRAAPALRRLFTDSVAADHGLIEPRPVLAALDRAVQGLPTSRDSLSQAVAVELWLRENKE
jgi:asparagine synthase (glutamine-hydrolysing)